MTFSESSNKQIGYIVNIPYNMKIHCNALEELKFTQFTSLKNKLFNEIILKYIIN